MKFNILLISILFVGLNVKNSNEQSFPRFNKGFRNFNRRFISPAQSRPPRPGSVQHQSQSTLSYFTREQLKLVHRCAPPAQKVQPNDWVTDASRSYGEIYMPLGHRLAYNKLNILINWEPIRNLDHIDHFCIKSNEDNSVFTAFQGRIQFQCDQYQNYFGTQKNAAVDSCGTNPGENAFVNFVTKTDGRTYRVVQQCWKSGEKTWLMYSTQKKIPYRLRQEIIQHVAELGFNLEDTWEISYVVCRKPLPLPTVPSVQPTTKFSIPWSKRVSTLLTSSKKILGRQCDLPPRQYIQELAYTSSLRRLSRKEEFYIPLMASTAYKDLFEFISGEAKTGRVPDEFCPKYEHDWNTYEARFLSKADFTDRMERISCTAMKDPFNQRKTINAQKCSSQSGDYFYKTYVTLTDNKTYMLSWHCWSNGRSTWMLFTPKPHISKNLKEEVLRHVGMLGFNSNDYKEIDYDQCPGEEHFHMPT